MVRVRAICVIVVFLASGCRDVADLTDAAPLDGSPVDGATLDRSSSDGDVLPVDVDAPLPDSVALYRCYNAIEQHHFASNAADCEGLGTQELLLGYALAQ